MARPSEALMNEAGEWIAEMLSEEGLMVTGGFVDLVLDMEWTAIEGGAAVNDRPALVEAIVGRMREENVLVGPPPETISTDGIDTSQIRPVPARVHRAGALVGGRLSRLRGHQAQRLTGGRGFAERPHCHGRAVGAGSGGGRRRESDAVGPQPGNVVAEPVRHAGPLHWLFRDGA